MTSLPIPDSLHRLSAAVRDEGGRAYVVGGGVRDHLLGQPIKDWDVEVFGVPVDVLLRRLERLGRVDAVGKAFGVLKWRPRHERSLPEIDVSIPRRDSKTGPGHRGISVEGDPEMTLEEAVRRRDLTINALMYDIDEGRIVDPAGGLDDLDAERLRAVDRTTFLEDPLRALRVVQFASRLGFTVDDELLGLCRVAALDELPAERVAGEWGKLLLKGRPSTGFAVARTANVLPRVFPEVTDHDADRTLDALAAHSRAEAPDEGSAWALMLAGWLAGCAPATVLATLDRLWIHTLGGVPVRDRVLGVLEALDAPVATDAELRWASTRAHLWTLLHVQQACTGEDRRSALARGETMGILSRKPRPLLQGRDLQSLGMKPGPAMGDLLRDVYAMQLDGTLTTAEEARAEAARRLGEG
ncbi:MAG: hypothetical protein AAF602_13955 [Myxococcota bacterium]